MKINKEVLTSVFCCLILGFVLTVAILEGLDNEGSRVFQGHAEKLELFRLVGKIK